MSKRFLRLRSGRALRMARGAACRRAGAAGIAAAAAEEPRFAGASAAFRFSDPFNEGAWGGMLNELRGLVHGGSDRSDRGICNDPK